jgi:lipoprotein-anchoring transpeptidase ErfK/SrfK
MTRPQENIMRRTVKLRRIILLFGAASAVILCSSCEEIPPYAEQPRIAAGYPPETPPGRYQVLSKSPDHVSTIFGDYVDDYGNVVRSNIDARQDRQPPGTHFDGAQMPYAMFFRGGYAMHQGYVPPYAASHGCIRLPRGMASQFFENAPVGTPVTVKE